MADISINNAVDLHGEIARLKFLKQEQGKAIAVRFSSPGVTFSTIYSLFSKSSGGAKTSIFNQDIFGVLSRILLPLTLNKTLFRNSNFIMKGIVGFVSQKASHFISEDSVMGIWDKVKHLFDKNLADAIRPKSQAL